jgi:hypothetical protein
MRMIEATRLARAHRALDADQPRRPRAQTISGLRFVVPISALTGGNGTTATYSSIQSLRITDFGIGGAVMTEPASWAMLIGGFGMAGASLRRRRAQPA